MKSAITISLVTEARSGPFVYHAGLDDGFARAAALGFDAVEIFPPSADALNVDEIAGLCAKHGLNVAACGTGAGWLKHQLRLSDANPEVRRRAVEFVTTIVDRAAELGAPAIIGSMQGRWEGAVSRDQALTWLAEGLEQIGARAEARGQPLLYEFLNRYETNLLTRVDDSLAFLRTLRTQNIRLLCDLFHMNIEEQDVAAALRAAGAKLGHVHFADSNRRAMGFGHTNLAPIRAALREIDYAGYLSAEIFPFPDGDAAATQTIAAFRQIVG